MRKTLGVSLLILLLSGSASAGEIPNDRPAPPQPTSAVQDSTTDGEIPNDATDSLTQLALDLFALLPSLL
jgi:hypothetical protein